LIPNLASGKEANLKILVSRGAAAAGALDLALRVREHLLSAATRALRLGAARPPAVSGVDSSSD
jgi:hypothetical protein